GQLFRQREAHLRRKERAVRFDLQLQVACGQQLAQRGIESRAEALEVCLADRQAGGSGVTAEAQQQPRRTFRDEIECVAQMQGGYGAPGALQLARLSLCEGDDWPMEALADACGQNADHALMPARIIERETIRFAGLDAFQM